VVEAELVKAELIKKRTVDKEYSGAVANLGKTIDKLGKPVEEAPASRAAMETQAVTTATVAKLQEQEALLTTKKDELKRTIAQAEALTDPNAQAKMRNAAENLKLEVQSLEARIAAMKVDAKSKLDISTRAEQKLAADLGAQAAKAKASASSGIEQQKQLEQPKLV
jgi:hypothetical protein